MKELMRPASLRKEISKDVLVYRELDLRTAQSLYKQLLIARAKSLGEEGAPKVEKTECAANERRERSNLLVGIVAEVLGGRETGQDVLSRSRR